MQTPKQNPMTMDNSEIAKILELPNSDLVIEDIEVCCSLDQKKQPSTSQSNKSGTGASGKQKPHDSYSRFHPPNNKNK